MSNAGRNQTDQAKPRFPWVLLVLLVAGIYVFWILPAQLGPRQVKLQYEPARTTR